MTDPPYGMSWRSNYRKVRFPKIENDDNLDFLTEFFEQCYRILSCGTFVYCFCSWHNVDKFKREFEKFFVLKNVLIWEKNNTGMGDLKGSYAPKYEIILFGTKGRVELRGRRFPDILKFSRTNNVYHPTEKPVDLLEFLLRNTSDEGDMILDPFMGSGSTGIACINTKRNFIGMEKDEKYFDVARNRIAEAAALR